MFCYAGVAQSVEQHEVFNLTTNVGYGVLGVHNYKDNSQRGYNEGNRSYEHTSQVGSRHHAVYGHDPQDEALYI